MDHSSASLKYLVSEEIGRGFCEKSFGIESLYKLVSLIDKSLTETSGRSAAPGSILQTDSCFVSFHVKSTWTAVVRHSAYAVGRYLCR